MALGNHQCLHFLIGISDNGRMTRDIRWADAGGYDYSLRGSDAGAAPEQRQRLTVPLPRNNRDWKRWHDASILNFLVPVFGFVNLLKIHIAKMQTDGSFGVL